MRQFFTMARLGAYQIKNKARVQLSKSPVSSLVVLLMAAGFVAGYIALSYYLLAWIFRLDDGDTTFAGYLVLFFLYVALGVSLMSSLNAAIANLYLSQDLEFQFHLPVNFNTWMLYRLMQIILQAIWMLLVFGTPFIWLFLYLADASVAAQLGGVLTFAVLASYPVLIATLICMALVKIFPARRVHQVFLIVTVVMISSFILLVRYLEPEQLFRDNNLQQFGDFARMMQPSDQPWNPAIWAYDVLRSLAVDDWMAALPDAAKLLGLLAALVLALLIAAHKIYRTSWDRALQSLAGELDDMETGNKPSRLSAGLSHPFWSQPVRESILFLRDPTQWSQLFVLGALLGLCLFSLTRLPNYIFGFSFAITGNLFVAFVALSIANRFVFISFSADGQAIWLMKVTPEGWGRFTFGKVLVYGTPVLLFAMALSLLSGSLMDLRPFQMATLGVYCLWDTGLILGLSLAFGMLFVSPNIENPLKLIVSPGGILLMASGLFMVGLHTFLRLYVHNAYLNIRLVNAGWPNPIELPVTLIFIGLACLEAIILTWLLRRGIHHLRKGDFF